MRVGVKAGRVLLHGNAEDSLISECIENLNSAYNQLYVYCALNVHIIKRFHLLLVGGVESENPHEEEVGARAEDENWAGEG